MKKISNTKKVIVAAYILTIALFVFPLSSFAKGGNGGRDSLVCAFRGDITGLVYDFGDGFALDFGIFEATITSVEVRASGQELTVVIQPKQYIYSATLSEGWAGSENGKILAIANLDFGDGNIVEDFTLEFEFDFATIFEQFKIKKKDIPDTCDDLEDITVPKKVDLFFEVTDAILIDNDVPLSDTFNLVLVIDKGKPVLVETFEFLYP